MTTPLPFTPFVHEGGSWLSTIGIDGRQVRVDVADALPGDPAEVADRGVRWLLGAMFTVLLACSDGLLDDYNEHWAEPDSDTMTPQDFVATLSVRELDLLASGLSRVVLRTKLFRGHDVVVEARADGEVADVFLEG